MSTKKNITETAENQEVKKQVLADLSDSQLVEFEKFQDSLDVMPSESVDYILRWTDKSALLNFARRAYKAQKTESQIVKLDEFDKSVRAKSESVKLPSEIDTSAKLVKFLRAQLADCSESIVELLRDSFSTAYPNENQNEKITASGLKIGDKASFTFSDNIKTPTVAKLVDINGIIGYELTTKTGPVQMWFNDSLKSIEKVK